MQLDTTLRTARPCFPGAKVIVLLFLPSIIRAPTLQAQEVGWSGAIEASANVLFGAARGRVVALKAGTRRADRMVEMQGDLLLTYADARTEDDEREVTARALRVSLGADYRPFERVSPFWFGSAESSLQQRIDRRYSTGAGAKLTLYREEEDDVCAGGDDQYPHCRHRHAARSLRQRSTVARRAQQSRRATAVRGTCIVLSDGAWHVPCTGDQSISSGRPSWQETAS